MFEDMAIEFVVFYSFIYNIVLCSVELYQILHKSMENLSRQISSIKSIVFHSVLKQILVYSVDFHRICI